MPSINDKIVLNFSDIRSKLVDLPNKLRRNAIRRGIYAGATLIRDDARRRVPVDTGALKASIIAKANARDPEGISAAIGVKKNKYVKGKKKGKNPQRYAHLVEFGTSHSAAKPFLRPAMDTNIDAVLAAVAAKIREGIAQETKT